MAVTISKPSHGDLNWDGPLGSILDQIAAQTPEVVTGGDNGLFLGVSGGQWVKTSLPATSVLPTVTGSDNGSVLTVVAGSWAKAVLPTLSPVLPSNLIASLTQPTGVPDGTVWAVG